MIKLGEAALLGGIGNREGVHANTMRGSKEKGRERERGKGKDEGGRERGWSERDEGGGTGRGKE